MTAPMSTPRTPWWAQTATTKDGTTADPAVGVPVRKYSARTLLAATLTAALIATLGTWVLHGTTVPDSEPTAGGGTAYRQSTQALVGGCGPTYQFTPHPNEIGPVPATINGKPNKQRYRTIVPMFGHYYDAPKGPATPPVRFYDRTAKNIPPVETLLAQMHTGRMVAWYTADANPADIAALKTLTNDPALDMIAAPWEHAARGFLPANRKIAYSVWGASQTCQRLVTPALVEFRTHHPATTAPGHQ